MHRLRLSYILWCSHSVRRVRCISTRSLRRFFLKLVGVWLKVTPHSSIHAIYYLCIPCALVSVWVCVRLGWFEEGSDSPDWQLRDSMNLPHHIKVHLASIFRSCHRWCVCVHQQMVVSLCARPYARTVKPPPLQQRDVKQNLMTAASPLRTRRQPINYSIPRIF